MPKFVLRPGNDLGILRDSGSKAADFAIAARGLPAGELIGQIPAKITATNYDVHWVDPPSDGGSTEGFEAGFEGSASLSTSWTDVTNYTASEGSITGASWNATTGELTLPVGTYILFGYVLGDVTGNNRVELQIKFQADGADIPRELTGNMQ